MKTLLLFMALALSLSSGICQSTSSNLDFENGNFNNWKTYCGTTESIDTITVSTFDPARFEIMTSGFDPMSGFALPVVAPGGNYSCRLGNSDVWAEAEKISYTINVSTENALFIYKYAIVLQDPGHVAIDQPQFEVKILNENGEITDTSCGYYRVSAAANLPGFHQIGDVVYKDWTTVGIDLSPYIGQAVTLCFITRDCTQGGHFGYAYIDAEASTMNIGTYACAGNDSLSLAAPIGFEYLWQPGGYTGRVLSIPSNAAVENYSCSMTSVTGCQIVLSASANIISIVPDFSFSSCDTTRFLGICLNDSAKIDSWNWTFGDGDTGLGENPLHDFSRTGPYNVTLTIVSESGCVASVTKNVEVIMSPAVILDPLSTCAGMAGSILCKSERSINEKTAYFWDFGDGTFSTEKDPAKKYNRPGNYVASLTLTNGPGCSNVAETDVEILSCEVEIPNVFTPNADGTNDVFVISNLESCSNNKLTVFNRWGLPVYTSETYNNTWEPENISPGVYYYVFEYSPAFPKGVELAKTGFVTVFREN